MIRRLIRAAGGKLKSFRSFRSQAIDDRDSNNSLRPGEISKLLIKSYLPSAPAILDCGAFDGKDTVQLVRILGGKAYAFEPVPYIYEKLLQTTAPYPEIACYPLALSDTTGKSLFYVSEGASEASSSLLKPHAHLEDHPDTQFNTQIEVDTITLDEWAESEGIEKLDLLWLDMQGFEYQMLQASPRMLSTVRLIHTEVSTKETYEGVVQYSELKDFLQKEGFTIIQEAIPAGWDMGNVLFHRR